MSLKATILIPTTGDRGLLLPLSVGSVLVQTEAELEVFIIGDGVAEPAREVIRQLCQRDPRVRFFDYPKGARRGETYRHAALAEARGEIVCYLCDRDLMLPEHVAVMSELLSEADFAHTLVVTIKAQGLDFSLAVDAGLAADRQAILTGTSLIPLAFAGHSLAMYRKLPHGWRRTPDGIYTDHYMWQQFLAHSECRAVGGTRPTILYFPTLTRESWNAAQRQAELLKWQSTLTSAAERQRFEQAVFVGMVRDRAVRANQLRTANAELAGFFWYRLKQKCLAACR